MEMELADDRRSDRRAADVTCYVVRVPSLEVVGERAIEISAHGMLVLSEAPVSIGEPLIVTFDVPGSDKTITTSGRVARVAPGRRACDPGKGFGVAFEDMDPEATRALREALLPLTEPTPKRPARVDYAATVQMIALTVEY